MTDESVTVLWCRVCLYLTSCVPYVPDPENTNLLRTALRIFIKFNQLPQVSFSYGTVRYGICIYCTVRYSYSTVRNRTNLGT